MSNLLISFDSPSAEPELISSYCYENWRHEHYKIRNDSGKDGNADSPKTCNDSYKYILFSMLLMPSVYVAKAQAQRMAYSLRLFCNFVGPQNLIGHASSV